jgi:hypothetical protein
MGLGGLALAGMIAEQGRATGAVAGGTHFAPRARRVIHFFCNGGPSHVDTFDPKPALAAHAGKPLPVSLTTERKTGGALPSEFAFARHGASGLEISELFAKTAAHADDIAVIRSMQAQVPNHEPSLMLMNCGNSAQPRPSVGAWVTYGLGSDNENLPAFVAMCPGGMPIKDSENWQAAFLPGTHQATFVDPRHTEVDRLVENIRSRHASPAVQRDQLDLLAALDAEHGRERTDPRLEARIRSFELAYRMQVEAADAFDIGREPETMCMAARRSSPDGSSSGACGTCSSGTGPASPGTPTPKSPRGTGSSPGRSTGRSRRSCPTSRSAACSRTRS